MNENDFSGVKKLHRVRDGRIIAGVAAGIGRYVGIDPNVVRVALAVTTLFGGLGVGIYAVGWLLMPAETSGTSVLQRLIDDHKDDPVWQDARAKAQDGWAKAESWAKNAGQNRTTPQHPGYADPTPYYSAPPPQGTTPQHGDEPRTQG